MSEFPHPGDLKWVNYSPMQKPTHRGKGVSYYRTYRVEKLSSGSNWQIVGQSGVVYSTHSTRRRCYIEIDLWQYGYVYAYNPSTQRTTRWLMESTSYNSSAQVIERLDGLTPDYVQTYVPVATVRKDDAPLQKFLYGMYDTHNKEAGAA